MNKQSYSDNLLDERHQQIMETLNQIESQQESLMSRLRWTEKMLYLAMGAITVIGIETFSEIIKTMLA